MAEAFLRLSQHDQREVLEIVREKTQRPTLLLEKDVWVVWTLGALFDSALAADLTFKGGTSLSKAYQVIDRFSEDIDLTCDIRKLIPDLMGSDDFLPSSRSQAGKWTRAVRERLPEWIAANVRPVLEAALARDQLQAHLAVGGEENDKLLLHYPALKPSSGYVQTVVTLEFGGRATGEPHQALPVACDMEGHVEDVSFPTAHPVVMSVARTFWEKATAAHVYCAQGRIRGERYARHWHDLAAIARSRYCDEVITDRAVAAAVADHKSYFFLEKDADGLVIDYKSAVTGNLHIVPEGAARDALQEDYAAMIGDGMMLGDPRHDLKRNLRRFDYVMEKFGITSSERGITAHGLRHEALIRRFGDETGGEAPPVRGGGPLPPDLDHAARQAVAEMAGHGRIRASGAYLGASPSHHTPATTDEGLAAASPHEATGAPPSTA